MQTALNICNELKKKPFWVIAFIGFSIVYGFFGDPTPSTVNLVTIAWISLLLLSFSWQNLFKLHHISNFNIASFTAFLVGLIGPLIVGALSGHDVILMSRDIVSYLFIFIGFLYVSTFCLNRNKATKVFLVGLLIIAFGMALRRLGFIPYGVERASIFEDPFALSVVPEILFGSIFLTSFAILSFLKTDKSVFTLIITSAFLLLMAIPLLAVMNMSVMRAGIGVVSVSALISVFILTINRPLAGISLSLLLGAVVLVFLKPLNAIFQIFWLKTIMIGTNNRFLEAQTVLHDVLNNPLTFLFGKGWGAVINNPAVGGEQVLYTHSLLSSSLLKGGLLLATLVLMYLLWLLTGIFRQLFREKSPLDTALYLAIIMTLLVNILIYGGYKTIGFGMVIALAMGMASCYGQCSRQKYNNRHKRPR